jgi:hypothetical protein
LGNVNLGQIEGIKESGSNDYPIGLKLIDAKSGMARSGKAKTMAYVQVMSVLNLFATANFGRE